MTSPSNNLIPSPFIRPPTRMTNIDVRMEEKKAPGMIKFLARTMIVILGVTAMYVQSQHYTGMAWLFGYIGFIAYLTAAAEAIIEMIIIGSRPNKENVLKEAIQQALKETEKIR